MNNNGFRKFISIALTVCLIFGLSGLTPLDGSVANAAIAPTMAETNYDQYQVKLTADPVTDAPPSGLAQRHQTDVFGLTRALQQRVMAVLMSNCQR